MLNGKIDLSAYGKDKAALFLFALNRILNIQAVVDLFAEVNHSGPVSIKIVPPLEAPFGALIELDRTIKISQDKPIYQAIEALLFELCNAANPGFNRTPCSHFENADDFATAIEKVEYYTNKRCSDLMITVAGHPYFRDILKAEFPKAGETLLNESCETIRAGYIQHQSASFEDDLMRLKVKQPGQILSHYDNYKKHYEDWKMKHRPLPTPPKASGRKLPPLPKAQRHVS